MPDESNNQGKPRAEGAQRSAAAEVIKRDYEVGYAKPPVATRFKKGKSGNPKGSKKASPIEDVRIVIENILMEPIELREGGKVRSVSKLEAIMQAQRINAVKGNTKAVRTLFKLGQKNGLFTKAKPRGGIVIDAPGTDEEKLLLRALEAQHGRPAEAADVKAGASDRKTR